MNPDNHVDLYVIHYIFLPIQHQLDVFQDAWACPSLLRTERNRIPHQLWVLGLHEANLLVGQSQEAVAGISAIRMHS